MQAAENVHKDLADLVHCSEVNMNKFGASYGQKYNWLLVTARKTMQPDNNYDDTKISPTLIKYTEDGEPTIATELFWGMVNKHKPRLYTLFTTIILPYIVPFTLLTFILWDVLSTLNTSHLVTASARLFLAIALAFGSVIVLSQSSSESKVQESEALTRKYQLDVLAYALYGQIYDATFEDIVLKDDVTADVAEKIHRARGRLMNLKPLESYPCHNTIEVASHTMQLNEMMLKEDVANDVADRESRVHSLLANLQPLDTWGSDVSQMYNSSNQAAPECRQISHVNEAILQQDVTNDVANRTFYTINQITNLQPLEACEKNEPQLSDDVMQSEEKELEEIMLHKDVTNDVTTKIKQAYKHLMNLKPSESLVDDKFSGHLTVNDSNCDLSISGVVQPDGDNNKDDIDNDDDAKHVEDGESSDDDKENTDTEETALLIDKNKTADDDVTERNLQSIFEENQVWIPPDDTVGLSCVLHQRDKEIILGTHPETTWICDRIVNAASQIIKHQYQANGLQDCLLVTHPKQFKQVTGEWYQIINTSPISGSHWVLLSTKGINNEAAMIPVVHLYDSLWTKNVPQSILKSMQVILYAPEAMEKLEIRHMKCDKQANLDDCGIHAIANLVLLVNNIDPTQIRYSDTRTMRAHLAQCLETKYFTPFPYDRVSEIKNSSSFHENSILKIPHP